MCLPDVFFARATCHPGAVASSKKSAGLLVYRNGPDLLEVFLVHPGGPFWAKKDEGAWSIPKGEFAEAEDPLQAARREFLEETGVPIDGDFERLEPVKQPSGKLVYAFLIRGDLDATAIKSNQFQMEWPPRSGTQRQFPEVDRAAWFRLDVARRKITNGQIPLLAQLERRLGIVPENVP
jgi:predicted NUDIX family NTP pyrophosphohydrolase